MTRLIVAVACFTTAMGLLIWIAAGALASASERAVTYRYIADALQATATPLDAVHWNAPVEAMDRPVTLADETLIGRALSDAWQSLAVAQSTGLQHLLADGFTGAALKRAEKSVADAQTGGGRMAVLSQTATPVFYHRDGSVFQAEIEMLTSRFLADGDVTGIAIQSRDKGVVTLMNESSGWRVFSFELTDINPIEPMTLTPDFSDLRGLNYYPAETPWRNFWPTYERKVIGDDFNRIASLGANAVRVFLPRADFLDSTQEAARLGDLSDLLAQAQTAGLKVIPTLFDLKSDYDPGTWAADAAYLRRIMPTLSKAGNVAFVDLKNEPDLDFDHHGQATVLAWLEAMTTVVRREAPELALTIGWAEFSAATWLIDRLDVVTYHDYAPISGAASRLETVRSTAGGKPVIVTEIGTSSYELAMGLPGSPDEQAASLSARLEALASADGVLIWTLHDFPEIDASAVGASPWVERLQSAFGLIAADGSEKPAATAVRSAFAKRAEP